MTARSIAELPDYIGGFEQAGKIFQPNGLSYQDDAKAMGILETKMCGVCLAGHFADFFETKVKSVPIEDINEDADICKLKNMGVDWIKTRDFTDGAAALYDRLTKSGKFINWVNKKFKDPDHIRYRLLTMLGMHETAGRLMRKTNYRMDKVHAVATYMREYGAPIDCFSASQWPEHISPAQVVRDLIADHPNI